MTRCLRTHIHTHAHVIRLRADKYVIYAQHIECRPTRPKPIRSGSSVIYQHATNRQSHARRNVNAARMPCHNANIPLEVGIISQKMSERRRFVCLRRWWNRGGVCEWESVLCDAVIWNEMPDYRISGYECWSIVLFSWGGKFWVSQNMKLVKVFRCTIIILLFV